MKKFILYMYLLPSLLCIVGCSLFGYQMDVTVLSMEQYYHEGLMAWSKATVNLKVENVGWGEIDYYEIYVEVTCIDDSIYTGYTNGYSLEHKETRSVSVQIDTENKQAVKARVSEAISDVY